MGIPYFPGCTLSTKAKNYDRSGRAVAAALGLDLEELPEWQCCGATFPLMLDDSLALIAPTRVLYQAQVAGEVSLEEAGHRDAPETGATSDARFSWPNGPP
jgi:heterodisulfide reductase subunit B